MNLRSKERTDRLVFKNRARSILNYHLKICKISLIYLGVGLLVGRTLAAESVESINQIADRLISGPFAIVENVFDQAAYILALILFIATYYKYKRFRKNPLDTPLGVVFGYAILSLAIFSIPFIRHLTSLA